MNTDVFLRDTDLGPIRLGALASVSVNAEARSRNERTAGFRFLMGRPTRKVNYRGCSFQQRTHGMTLDFKTSTLFYQCPPNNTYHHITYL